MLQNLQNFANFQKFQLDNLVDLKNAEKRVFSCKDRRRYSRKRANFCRKIAKKAFRPGARRGDRAARREGDTKIIAGSNSSQCIETGYHEDV